MNRLPISEGDGYMDMAKALMAKRSALMLLGLVFLIGPVVTAQNPATKDELAAIGQAQLTNQIKLSHYAWQETQFISIKGEAVDYRLYSVSVGANGQYQRELVTEDTGQEAIFEPTITEQLSQYGPYAQQLCNLADQYTTLSSEQLAQANSRGEVTLLREDNSIKLAIKNYSKPGDFVAMTINPTHRLMRVQAKSYLTNPQDAVTIQAEFAELPDGTNHVATTEIESISSRLTVKLTNWSYQ
jgi:hypothetical protein